MILPLAKARQPDLLVVGTSSWSERLAEGHMTYHHRLGHVDLPAMPSQYEHTHRSAASRRYTTSGRRAKSIPQIDPLE